MVIIQGVFDNKQTDRHVVDSGSKNHWKSCAHKSQVHQPTHQGASAQITNSLCSSLQMSNFTTQGCSTNLNSNDYEPISQRIVKEIIHQKSAALPCSSITTLLTSNKYIVHYPCLNFHRYQQNKISLLEKEMEKSEVNTLIRIDTMSTTDPDELFFLILIHFYCD